MGRNVAMQRVRTLTVSGASNPDDIEVKATARVTIDDGSIGTNEAFAITPEPTAIATMQTITRKEMVIIDDAQ